MEKEKYYLFLDESGDHGLANINLSFPVFLLCGVLFEKTSYEKLDEEMNQVKEKFWNSREVIFHSSDIRRIRKEFQILFDLDLKAEFIKDINTIVSGNDYTIIADGIHKQYYIQRYGKLSSVYELCLSFIIERAVFRLDEIPTEKQLYLIIEERGKKEDQKLKEYISKVLDRGTAYVKPERLKALNIKVEFRSKKKNINGLQLADLVAYPIATKIIDKSRANPAFDLLNSKFYRRNGKIYGFKTFP